MATAHSHMVEPKTDGPSSRGHGSQTQAPGPAVRPEYHQHFPHAQATSKDPHGCSSLNAAAPQVLFTSFLFKVTPKSGPPNAADNSEAMSMHKQGSRQAEGQPTSTNPAPSIIQSCARTLSRQKDTWSSSLQTQNECPILHTLRQI